MTGRADFYEEGGFNAVCFECGRKRKGSMLQRHWRGYYVCPEHNEPREAQDFVRTTSDIQTPPWVQPPSDTFRTFCSVTERAAIPGYALPGCLLPGETVAYT